MDDTEEPEPVYQTEEGQHKNDHWFIIKTVPGEESLSRFGIWQMKFMIANIDNINTLTIGCGITSIADGLNPKMLPFVNRMKYEEIARYEQCVSIQYNDPTVSPKKFEIVVKCRDKKNGTFNYKKVPVRHSLWTHGLFYVRDYAGAAEKIMEALSWTSAKLKQLEQQQLSPEIAMRNIYFVELPF